MDLHTAADMSDQFKLAFAEDPRNVLDYPPDLVAEVEYSELDAARLAVAQKRFAAAVQKIDMIRQLAERNQISAINSVDDLTPLLYSQDTLKSYPQSWLEQGDFKRLTKWLGKICAADLSKVDATGCALIEDWMQVLKDQSVIDLQISAGADGKAAFLPRAQDEWNLLHRLSLWNMQAAKDSEGNPIRLQPGVDKVPLIYFGARRGARSLSRFLDHYEATYGEGLVDTLLEYNDSDLLSLAGRIREASKKGEAGLLQISPELLARKDEIARVNADRPQRMEALMQRLLNEYRGKRIICQGTMQILYDLAIRFKEMGVKGAYTPDSLFITGSGFTNGVEPPNWKQDVAEAFGIPESSIRTGYAMQESIWSAFMCEQGKYHFPQTVIPFILDENNDKPLPRTGKQTGRFAFFDLMPTTSWGGYTTSDRVTMNWDTPCTCGRKGIYADSPISKVTDKQDDKISCAGTANALEEATDFLLKS